jgi:RES domain-containing protein
MIVFRVCRRQYADLSGRGGVRYSGRWHRKGNPIVYAAGSVALAALEYAVHTSVRPTDSVLMEIEVPDLAWSTIEERIGGELPGNWSSIEEQSRQLGTEWLLEKKTLMLSVPSVVIPFERNLLLNPRHNQFKSVLVKRIAPFFFDPRIFGSGGKAH